MAKRATHKSPPTTDPRGRCGTRAGYAAHLRRGERACTACKQAKKDAENARRFSPGAAKKTAKKAAKKTAKRAAKKPAVPKSAVKVTPKAKTAPSMASRPAPKPAAEQAPPAPEKEAAPVSNVAALPVNSDQKTHTPRNGTEPAPSAGVDIPEGIPTPPDYLRAQGRALWVAVLEDYEMNKAGRALLGEACRTVDRLERLAGALSSRSTLWFELENAIEDNGLAGSETFNVVVNGMIGESRQLQTSLRQTLNQLGVVTVQSTKTTQATSVLDQLAARRAERQARLEAQ